MKFRLKYDRAGFATVFRTAAALMIGNSVVVCAPTRLGRGRAVGNDPARFADQTPHQQEDRSPAVDQQRPSRDRGYRLDFQVPA